MGNTEFVKEVLASENLEKRIRTREPDQNINFVLTPELDSQVIKGEDQSSDHKAIKKSYSSVIKSYLVRESNNNPTISCRLKIETTPSPTTTSTNAQAVQKKSKQDSENSEKVPSNISNRETLGKTSKKRKCKNRNVKFGESTMTEEEPQLEMVPELEIVPELDKFSKPSEKTMIKRKEVAPEAGNLSDNIEVEKKKFHKKKKKFDKQDSEGGNSIHRVIICDDQVRFQNIFTFICVLIYFNVLMFVMNMTVKFLFALLLNL